MLIRLFCSVTFDSWLEHWLVPASPCGKFLEFIPLFCLTFVVGAKGKKVIAAVVRVQQDMRGILYGITKLFTHAFHT